MKKKIVSLITCLICAANLYPQMLGLLNDSVHGPVKQVTVTSHPQELYTGETMVWKHTASFSPNGQMIEYKRYINDCMVESCKYHYTTEGNYCICQDYDIKGAPDDSYGKIILDADGKKIAWHRYWKGKPTLGDSLVYNQQGKIVKKYEYPYNRETQPELVVVYTYDSIGRLTGETDLKQKKSYTITYLPNGNYIKQFYENNNKKQKETYIFNKGLLFKIKTHDGEHTFINYDRYGNWGKRVFKFNKSSLSDLFGDSVTERTIEYYE